MRCAGRSGAALLLLATLTACTSSEGPLGANTAADSSPAPAATAAAPPVGPSPSPTPTVKQSQSSQTWVDTALTPHQRYPWWEIPDPLKQARNEWFAVAADHLDPTGEHFDPLAEEGSVFTWRTDGLLYPVGGRTGVVVDRNELDPLDGCEHLLDGTVSNGSESCNEDRLAGPDGERGRISRYQRMCETWDPGQEGDDARPGPGNTYETCGDFRVAVTLERDDGLIGYLVVDGRGTLDYNPFAPAAMAAVAADPRLTLPDAVADVPSKEVAASVLSEHFSAWGVRPTSSMLADQPGYAGAAGRRGRTRLLMSVLPAGGDPVCGRAWLVSCVERHVYGADDPTTVFVGAWDEHDWADCCPKNSRAFARQLVHVGQRNTVVVWLTRIVREHEDGIGDELDQRVIDVLLDPRLQ